MAVTQEFINLLNLPREQLQDMAEKLDVAVPSNARKWDLVRALSQISDRKLAANAGQWIFAGRTSITYVRLGDGTPLDEGKLIAALTEMCDGTNPLNDDVRPDALTRKPSLIDVAKMDGKFFLSFGLQRPVAQVLNHFELEVVESDEFFVAVIRPDKAILEIRTNHQRAERLTTTWLAEFNEFLFGDGGGENE